jgi:uncharacterized RDD family membrane protein YckC
MLYFAQLRIRLVAAIVDQFLFWGLLMFFFIGFPGMIDDGVAETWKPFIIMMGFWVFYFPLAEGISGQTIGKKIFKIKVIKEDGSAVVFGDTIIRRILDIVDFLFLGLLGFLIARSTRKKQRMGDMIAKTIVVNESVTACEKCGAPLALNPEILDAGAMKCSRCNHSMNWVNAGEANVPPA